jgi:pimeloyl-ACP methyl ester carboxylesterase
MTDAFTPLHFGGSGPPLVLLHGFTATWRARSVVALARASGWAEGDDSYHDVLDHFVAMERSLKAAVRNVDALLATPAGQRLATQHIVERCGHCPQLDVPVETAELILGFTG